MTEGGVRIYETYDVASRQLRLLHYIPIGNMSAPKMLLPTPDCSTLVVALENRAGVNDADFRPPTDPPGEIGIIRFKNFSEAPTIKILNFTDFDSQFDKLSLSGVRWMYRGTAFSDNCEPEYVTFNTDYSIAFVSLQENNAIAVVNMTSEEITAIHGLGFKQWGKFDGSYKDGGFHLQEWDVLGMYQPDGITFLHWEGHDYIVTANLGESVHQYYYRNITENLPGVDYRDIADTVSEDLRAALHDVAKLGQVVFARYDGKNAAGNYEKFYTFGARSFSIWRADNMSQVFDSGSDFEVYMGRDRPDIFNSYPYPDRTLSQSMDMVSIFNGPQPNCVTMGTVEGHLLIFIATRSPGAVAVYSVSPGDGTSLVPEFQTLFTEGVPRDGERTWQQLLDDRQLYAVDSEYIKFFSPSDGLADVPVLVVGGSTTQTVTILRVDVAISSDTSVACLSTLLAVAVLALSSAVLLQHSLHF